MTKPATIVFLLDVDKPVLDIDRIIADLKVYLAHTFGERDATVFARQDYAEEA